MQAIWYNTYKTQKDKPDTLIVLLPGRYDAANEFEKQGFIDAIRKAGVVADAVAVESHIGYYNSRTLLERLREDIICPARKKGYRQIWITGISIGGLGALLYAQKYPDTIDGIFIIAPFLGDDEVIKEIENAGGLVNWLPKEIIKQVDYQRMLWIWLKKHTIQYDRKPIIAIGWGKGDKFARANSLLAGVLPQNRIFITNGRHNWEPWKKLWHSFLASGTIR